MAGLTKLHRKRQFGRDFPNSQYDDPRGGRASSLEKNILRYRAIETVLYLFYADEIRTFMMANIYPRAIQDTGAKNWESSEDRRLHKVVSRLLFDAETTGAVSSSDANKIRISNKSDSKHGRKLREAFGYAVSVGMFTEKEIDQLQELLKYRNDIAHRIHLVMSDVTRSYWTSSYVATFASTYKGDALEQLCNFRNSLWERAASFPLVLSMDSYLFEHAERAYEEELKRLEKRIQNQIAQEQIRIEAIKVELDLSKTELVGDLNPRFPLNHHMNGVNGGPDSGHLTKRGVEICYRLYDLGKSPIAVAYLMGMSLCAAQVRQKGWLQVGGTRRERAALQKR